MKPNQAYYYLIDSTASQSKTPNQISLRLGRYFSFMFRTIVVTAAIITIPALGPVESKLVSEQVESRIDYIEQLKAHINEEF